MGAPRVLKLGSPKPDHCVNQGCAKPVSARGACVDHYRAWHKMEARRLMKREVKAAGGTPENGVGLIACAVCGRKMSDHGVTEWCAFKARWVV